MIRSRSNASPRPRRRRAGFTLVELLVVILILAVLIALLVPTVGGALRSAKNAAVGAEINQLAQALNSFKAKYGDYPPSRILLVENGNYGVVGSPLPLGPGDISVGQLAQRSLAALRKFFPKVTLSTSGPVFASGSLRWYDFNGNGVPDGPYILQGHQCLVFFLGGIPSAPTSEGISMTGFGKDPANPFTNSITGHSNYSGNRQAPLFEFAPSRLVPDPYIPYPSGVVNQLTLIPSQIPGYFDSLGNTLGDQINFYAYFSSYGNSGYDPNDVNFPETDTFGAAAALAFKVAFPVVPPAVTGVAGTAGSPAPNPYTSTATIPVNPQAVPTGAPPTYYNPQTFQIISAGADGQYGLGGQYTPEAGSALPLDGNSAVYLGTTNDERIRAREADNVTNFHSGRLQ
ncbi:MAG: prepilin-type N-terminal cleavage/methylation domain-containing protein [Isosphaeraceae bacterium]